MMVIMCFNLYASLYVSSGFPELIVRIYITSDLKLFKQVSYFTVGFSRAILLDLIVHLQEYMT